MKKINQKIKKLKKMKKMKKIWKLQDKKWQK